MDATTFVLGGYQTDFALSLSRRGGTLFDLLREATEGALGDAALDFSEIETAHVGNFTGELFARQGLLGGLLASVHPDFAGLPTMRHEAACASGGVALLAATAEIEAGRYDVALVVGVEQERNVSGEEAARNLGVAAWSGQEAEEARYPWPYLFDRIIDAYERRHGIDPRHLARIGEINLTNAKNNPRAQTRGWRFSEASFRQDDEANPVVEGRIRRNDCSQVTDGACAVILASPRFAEAWARRRGRSLDATPRLLGWGHRSAPMRLRDKLAASEGQPLLFPVLRRTVLDAFRRARLPGVEALQGLEVHDCFTISEYAAIDHFGLTAPGESWKAIEDGRIEPGGALPINPSGGLIGGGHPVGATGVRQVHDAALQVSGRAGAYQVPGARIFGTLNIGGSATTSVCFLVGRQ
jgi:acetyl-CoA C-acetyltransferase